MQDPSMYQQQQIKPPIVFPEQEHLKCPRCDSNNTKFCYYNNYNLSQPRHFCKNCRRYWTKGGALRNIPVGGGTRKATKKSSNPKRPSPSLAPATSAAPAISKAESSAIYGMSASISDQERRFLEIPASFGSLLGNSNGQFGNLMEGLNPNGLNTEQMSGFGENPNLNLGSNVIRNSSIELQRSDNSEAFQSGGDSSCWGGGGGGNGWPDLAIFTPGSNFQ